MLTPLAPVYRPPGKRPRRVPPPRRKALSLVAATYVASTSLELTFDRAIDISNLVENQILINDGPTGLQFQTVLPATQTGPAKVRFDLLDVQAWTGTGVHLNATDDTGIKAADNGAGWVGAANVPLPYP